MTRVDILLALKSELKGQTAVIDFIRDFTGKLTIATAAYGAFTLARNSGRLAGEIKSLALEANLTTNAFQALKMSAMGYNVQQETLVRGAVVLRQNLEEAATNGASPLNQHLTSLKLTAAGLQALSVERQFEVIGRAIANAADKEAAFRAGIELLGAKSAPKLMEFLRVLGAEGFDKIAETTKALTLTPAELETLDRAANAWQRIGEAIKLIGARATLAAVNIGDPNRNNLAAARAFMNMGGLHGAKSLAAAQAAATGVRPASAPGVSAAQVEALAEQMRAGDNAAAFTNEAMEKRRLARVKAEKEVQKDMLADLKARVAAGETENAQLLQQSERYKNIADPLREYRVQLEEIKDLKARNLLTEQEEAAAIKAVTQAMLEQAGAIGARTRVLSELAEARRLTEGDPFISANERASRLAGILKQENAELDTQIRLLRQKAQLSPDESRQLDSLVKRRTDNRFDPAGMSPGQQIGASVMGLANSFGTTAQQTANVITNTIGRSVDAVGQGIYGWLTGTTTWGQMLQQLGDGVLQEIINFGVRMGAQMLLNATVGRALQTAQTTATLATTAATAAGISAMMIGPATLATIATMGAAAAQAPFAILAAKAATMPMGFFRKGGHTGKGGIVHEDEWVAPDWMVSSPTYGPMIDALEAARTNGGGTVPAPAGAGSGRPQRMVHTMARDRGHARELMRDPEFDNRMLDWSARHRGEIASR